MPFPLQPSGPRSYYPFRFFDDVTKKWTRARYVADLHVIAERYAQWEIIGPPEIRSGHANDVQSMGTVSAAAGSTPASGGRASARSRPDARSRADPTAAAD